MSIKRRANIEQTLNWLKGSGSVNFSLSENFLFVKTTSNTQLKTGSFYSE